MKKVVKILLYSFVAILLIISIVGILSKDKVEIPSDLEGSYIEVSEVKVRYKQIGTGQDILLIHGVPGSIEDWDPVINELSSNFRVTTYDRPGQGYSSAENIGYNLKHNAHISLGIIKKLNLKDVIIVGHSYGGSVVMEIAVRNPHGIKAYIAVAGATNLVEDIEPIFKLIKIPIIGRGFAAATSSLIGPGMIKEGINQAFYPNENKIPKGYVETRMKIWLQPKVTVTIAKEELNLNSDLEKIIPKYGDIFKKFIIIHGEDDLLVPKDDSVKLNKIIKHSKLILLSKTGHQVQYERPEILIQTIKETAANY
jgi:pimeloyl-ACP methyl ester carboxylesterase